MITLIHLLPGLPCYIMWYNLIKWGILQGVFKCDCGSNLVPCVSRKSPTQRGKHERTNFLDLSSILSSPESKAQVNLLIRVKDSSEPAHPIQRLMLTCSPKSKAQVYVVTWVKGSGTPAHLSQRLKWTYSPESKAEVNLLTRVKGSS